MTTQVASIARRVSLTGVVTVAVVLLVVSTLLTVLTTKLSRERVIALVGAQAQGKLDSIEAIDMTSRVQVESLFTAFRQEFGPSFTLEPSGDLRDWGPKLNGNFTQVDKFSSATGGVATVFALKGDDFERITSSLKKENGERAMGTMLGSQHPAFTLLKASKPYTGRTVLFGKPYMTRYEPIKDDGGKLVGALFVGFDLTAFESPLAKIVAETKFFESGGLYMVTPGKDLANSVFFMHPTAKGKKVTDVAPGMDKVLAELAAAPDGYLAKVPSVLGSSRSDLFAVLRKSEVAGQWVIAEVPDSEAMRSHWAALVPFWLLLSGATVALGAGLFWMMRNWVAAPLKQLSQAVSAVAQGDLTQPVSSNRSDEIGELMRDTEAMRLRLAQMIGTVRHSVDSISTASVEIASGNQDLSSRTEQTASNLQQAASSMHELTATVKQSADAARTANQLASSAASVASRGGEVVSQVVTTMDEINTSSKKISDIIGVIDGIAFQTNILALNAAVEAARAGEQGRGFAVVAGEVRSLAQRSAEAAKEIKTLIAASVDRVETGARLVQDAGATMTEIVASVQRVTDIIGEITAASSEQSDGISTVNTSVVQLDQMTQQNAALVEESAAAAESLREQAHKLSQVVGVFRLNESDSRGQADAPAAARPAGGSHAAPAPRPPAPPSGAAKPVSKTAPKKAPMNKPAAAQRPPVVAPAAAPKPATSPATSPAGGEGDWESF
ncbi:methyl-accepting chemotaxis protein [Roseateles toxinivorans]|uniref:Methyl-accepting chemotaxis protein-2 (Aspartate sensor receptor) n=1 Tax=Roseateles toxinivorans TaxID=270368 RepID=A0A4R6QN77_9BURK|nr:methyl-accepting chemotaxis protein [Roseateles toxinivorans]TDP71590.1 methyl-accepting chemotaxis protein-2 (aspartate sensor receptor) [Roseateles toxinivorans]